MVSVISFLVLVGLTVITVNSQRRFLFISEEKINYLKDKIENEIEPFDDFYSGMYFTATRYEVPTPAEWAALSEVYYRPWGETLPNVCLTYLLTEDTVHLDFAFELMDAMATTYSDWSVNLGLSHLLYGFATCFDWLYDQLSPARKTNYVNALLLYGDQLFQKVSGQSGPDANNRHFNLLHNIINVNAAAVGIAGYALQDEPTVPDSSVPDSWVTMVRGIFDLVLEYAQRDGTSQEGIMYYSYELWARVAWFALEDQFLGDEEKVLENPFFRNTGKYRIHASVPGFYGSIMLGDTSAASEWGPDYYLYRLAALFKDPHLQWLAKHVVEMYRTTRGYYNHGWKTLVWYDETVVAEEINDSNTVTHALFNDSEIFLSRESWEDADSIFLTFKSGPACGHHFESLRYPKNIGICGAGHHHPDNGAITLYLNGEMLLKDDGYVTRHPTAHHNCVTFGEERRSQYGDPAFQGETFGGWLYRDYYAEEAFAEISHTEFNADFEYLVTDLTRMYPLIMNLSKYERHLVFLKKKYVVIFDDIEFQNGTSYGANVHFHSPLEGNQTLEETKIGEYYEYRRESASFAMLELERDDLGHVWEIDGEYEKGAFKSKSFLSTAAPSKEHTFFNIFIPFSTNETVSPRIKNFKILRNNGGSVSSRRVDFEDLKVVFDFENLEIRIVNSKDKSDEVDPKKKIVSAVIGTISGVLFAAAFLVTLVVLCVFLCLNKKRKDENVGKETEM